MRKNKEIELLLPAGDLEKAKFAFAFGADAVYAGVPIYALRAKENTFDITAVKEIIDYAHSIGKKVYLTTNIYPHNHKIPGFLKAMEEMVKAGPDAFIVSDPGLIMLIKEQWPDVELHLSVQQNNVNWASAKFWKQNGIERIILARELTLEEVKEICEKNPDMEFEYFVHGAMCIAYSGRCLLSNYLTGRDANQGVCAQSCRWQYKVLKKESNEKNDPLGKGENYTRIKGEYVLEEKLRPGEFNPIEEDEHGTYIMNSRDLCMIDYLQELMDAGICSFKIEGRNKSIYYAAITAKVYREAIDTIKRGEKPDTKKLLKELQTAANRGFIPGLLLGDQGAAGQRYEINGVLQTHLFLGKVIEQKDTALTVEVKNRIDVGDLIEIITPTQTHSATVTGFEDGSTSVHPGTPQATLILDTTLHIESKFALVRREGQQKTRTKQS